MKRFIPRSLLLSLPIIFLYIVSCTQGSCFEETESYLKASFYDDETKLLTAPDSVTLYGLNIDTTRLYSNTSGVSTALIPLDASSGSSIFIIEINGVADTIEFRYSSYPHLISKECGYTYYHQLDSEPRHTFNSIIDIYAGSKTITNENGENIRIFY
jgi:Family of unknown function (DUF6452)